MQATVLQHKAHSPADRNDDWQAVRAIAAQCFATHGFPSKKLEPWKYTSLKLADAALIPAAPTFQADAQEALAGHYVMTLVDGRVDSARSRLPSALSVVSLSDGQDAAGMAVIRRLYREAYVTDPAAMTLTLNIARAEEALVLHLPAGASLDAPLEIHHVLSDDTSGSRYSQLWLWLEADSNLTLLERFYGASDETVETLSQVQNHITVMRLDKAAHLAHYRVQDAPRTSYHLYTARLELADHSDYRAFTLSAGGQLSRQETRAALNGRHIRCDQQGITLGTGDQHHDAFLPVWHHQPESFSNQHFRQLLDGQAKGIFYGSVQVPEHSHKTEAHQLNHNMLLSGKAQAFTRPELDIFTDDVVCSHGATVGNLDEQALYYLQTRGVSREAAKRMLIRAFAEKMLEEIPHAAVRDLMRQHLHNASERT